MERCSGVDTWCTPFNMWKGEDQNTCHKGFVSCNMCTQRHEPLQWLGETLD